MKRCVICLCLYLTGHLAIGQFCSLDSVFALKNSSVFTSDDEKGVCYIDLGIELAGKEKKLECGIEALDRAIPFLKDSLQIVRATCIKGLILGNLGRYDESKRVLLQILPFCEKRKPFIESTYLNWIIEGVYDGLAQSCTFTGDYGLAITFAYTSLELGLLFPEKADICGKYVNLALLYYKIRDNVTAVRMYKKSIPLETDFVIGYPATLSNLALCYSEMDSIDKAIFYLDSAASAAKAHGLPKGGMFWDFAHGMIDLKRSDPDSAKHYFKRSLKKSLEWDYPRMVADNHVYLARVYLVTGDYDSARYELLDGEAIAKANNFNEILLDIYRQSVALYEKTKDNGKLAIYQQKFIDQKARMYSSELARDIAVVQGEIVEKEHLESLAAQQNELKMQDEVLKLQLWIRHISFGIAALVLLLLILQYHISHQRRKTSDILELRTQERSTMLNLKSTNILNWSCRLKLARDRLKIELEACESLLSINRLQNNSLDRKKFGT